MNKNIRLIYDHRLDSAFNTLRKSKINKYNKTKILEFDEFINAKGYSDSRRAKYLRYLRILAEQTNVNFNELTEKGVVSIVSKIKNKDWAEWTVCTTIVLLKTFMKWLTGKNKVYPECVEWLKPKVKEQSQVKRKDILEPEDIKKMISCCNNDMDRLLISLLWEGGIRIGELVIFIINFIIS